MMDRTQYLLASGEPVKPKELLLETSGTVSELWREVRARYRGDNDERGSEDRGGEIEPVSARCGW